MSQQVIPTLIDHEKRHRSHEKYISMTIGGVGVLGAIIAWAISFLKHN